MECLAYRKFNLYATVLAEPLVRYFHLYYSSVLMLGGVSLRSVVSILSVYIQVIPSGAVSNSVTCFGVIGGAVIL